MKYIRNEKAIKLLGKKIKALRINQKISQSQLAFEANIPRTQISRIETGIINTSISTIIAIAKALDIPLKDLFDF